MGQQHRPLFSRIAADGGTPVAMQNARYAAHVFARNRAQSSGAPLSRRRSTSSMCFRRHSISRRRPSSRSICGGESDLFASAFRRADAISHQRRLAPRRVVDRLIAAGQVDQPFGHLLQRRALPSPDIVEAVGRRLPASRRCWRRRNPPPRRNRKPPTRRRKSSGLRPLSIASSIFMITAI